MSNARIQFSLATEEVWLAYNPFLKEGEIVTSVKANKKVKLIQGKIGGSNYSDSTLIWDQDNAESLTSRSETAATTAATKASTAASSASAAAASQAAAANSASAAAGSATAAKNSETTAKASETAGANSAKAAAASASTASEKATAAANSASAAASSASQAQSSASTATTKAYEAETSATAAFESKTAAATSASAAEIKANEAADSASAATAKVIEATDEANRAKAEADRAKSISDTIGNPVSDVTENNGSVTVTKSDGTQSTFMAFPQGENGALPIVNGGTGATTKAAAQTNLGLNDAITALSISGNKISYTQADGGTGSVTVPTGAGARAYVTETYVNGTLWYRIWSDGWKEQGGRVSIDGTVTYLKAFNNTNYTLLALAYGSNTSGYFNMHVTSYSKTTFSIGTSNWDSAFWYACGY